MHQSSDTILSRLVKWYPGYIQISCKTRFQNQTSVALRIIALPVEVVHCKFRGVHHAEEVGIEDLEVGFGGFFGLF
jgi:hypothetical protein